MSDIYIHTIDGRPAFFSERDGQIVFTNHYGKSPKPAYSLAQIKKEQVISKEYRKLSGYHNDMSYGYRRYNSIGEDE